MRVVCIDPETGEVLNVIEVESIENIPNIVGVREDGTPIKKEEVKIIPSEVGSVGDIYIEGKGFFRFVGA